MSKLTPLVTTYALVLCPALGGAAGELAAAPREVKTLVENNNAFALDLYARLSEQEGNLFLSPFSISSALAMTYAGANGQTAEQMAKTLHFTQGDALHPAFAALLDRFKAEGKKRPYELHVANALWGQKGYPWLPEYLALTQKYYDAGLNQVDFPGATEQARQTINKWVEDRTQGKIKDLFPEGVLDDLTRLVLTNAIYFKGKWASQFRPQATQEQPFFTSPDQEVRAKLMYQKARFGFFDGGDLLALEMPYQGDDLSMVVLLPKQVDGLANLEKKLSAANVNDWLGRLRRTEVQVWLPRFQMTSQFKLNDVLAVMGMPDAFDMNKADFSRMNGGEEDLYIQAVVHKAFVEVNEEGTEAAAATGVAVGTRSIQISPQFRADHPFLFLIRSKADGSMLFMGRVTDPTK